MAKSKSKTFPKGTRLVEIKEWVESHVDFIDGIDDETFYHTKEKVLITITKYPEKHEKAEQTPLHP